MHYFFQLKKKSEDRRFVCSQNAVRVTDRDLKKFAKTPLIMTQIDISFVMQSRLRLLLNRHRATQLLILFVDAELPYEGFAPGSLCESAYNYEHTYSE